MRGLLMVNRELLSFCVGDIIREEWIEGDAWLTGQAVMGYGEPYAVLEIIPGDGGWIGPDEIRPQLIAQNLMTGQIENLISADSYAFLSMRTRRPMRRNPYVRMEPSQIEALIKNRPDAD